MQDRAPFLAGNQISLAIAPVDLHTGANAGKWADMARYQRVLCVLALGARTASDFPVITLNQAQNNAGLNAKAINFTTIFQKLAPTTVPTQFTKIVQAAADTFTDAVAGAALGIIGIEILSEYLDSDGGFTHLQMSVAATGSSMIGCGLYIGLDGNNQTEPSISMDG